MKIAVLGAGLAGLSAAEELTRRGHEVVVLEKEHSHGGLAVTIRRDGFQYDLGPHRFHTSNSLILDFIKELDELKPVIYHIADGHLDNEKDEHLGIGEGEYDLAAIFNCLAGSENPITLETPRKNLQDDIENLEKIKNFLI